MKIFEHGDKVNFIDINNVFVGYDLSQKCCEDADWFIADTPKHRIAEAKNNYDNLEPFVFDVSYVKDMQIPKDDYTDENIVIFRLTDGDRGKYLHLYNCHNSFYSHGFEFVNSDKSIIDKGTL